MSQSCRNQEDGVVVGEDPNPPEESSGSLSLLPGLSHQSAADALLLFRWEERMKRYIHMYLHR